ncbi:MAG: hypothetical protein KDB70_04230 [Mycobacterium sp.]|nr:hypothetical protein [Mycobacterium sp.]
MSVITAEEMISYAVDLKDWVRDGDSPEWECPARWMLEDSLARHFEQDEDVVACRDEMETIYDREFYDAWNADYACARTALDSALRSAFDSWCGGDAWMAVVHKVVKSLGDGTFDKDLGWSGDEVVGAVLRLAEPISEYRSTGKLPTSI